MGWSLYQKQGTRASVTGDRHAFSLLELAVALMIVGLMSGMYLKLSATTDRNECYTTSKAQVEKVKQAVDRFAISNRRFPLPARRYVGVDSNVYGKETPLASITDLDATPPNADGSVAVFGAVPHATLGMAMDDSFDCWGNKLTYVVTKALTNTTSFANDTPGAITVEVKSGATYSDKIGYAVIVHGEDQLGAAKANFHDLSATTPDQRKWCAADGSPKTANCNVTSSFRLAAPFNNGDNPAKYFDDVIIFRGKPWGKSNNLYCWGHNGQGQVGNGTQGAPVPVPTPVTRPAGVYHFTDVSHGFMHFCAVGDNGKVYCWGYNGTGALGNSSTDDKWQPTPVDMSGLPAAGAGISFTRVSAGYIHSCALDSTGKAYCWGYNGSGALGIGHLGGGAFPIYENKPTEVDMSTMPLGVTFKTIAASKTTNAGTYVTCALGTDEKIYCWGGMGSGVINVTKPQLMSNLTFTSLYTDGWDSSAIGTNGEVYHWGVSAGQVTPLVPLARGSVPAGVMFTSVINHYTWSVCALGDDHKVYCWMYNAGFWQPPTGPQPAVDLKSISAASINSICGITMDDRIYCRQGAANQYTNLPSGATRPNQLAWNILFHCALTE